MAWFIRYTWEQPILNKDALGLERAVVGKEVLDWSIGWWWILAYILSIELVLWDVGGFCRVNKSWINQQIWRRNGFGFRLKIYENTISPNLMAKRFPKISQNAHWWHTPFADTPMSELVSSDWVVSNEVKILSSLLILQWLLLWLVLWDIMSILLSVLLIFHY